MRSQPRRRHSRFPAVDREIPQGRDGETDVATPPPATAPPAPPPMPEPESEPEPVEDSEAGEELTPEEEPTSEAEVETSDESDDAPYTAVGGGWYELADGRRIQGLDNAKAALEEKGSPADD